MNDQESIKEREIHYLEYTDMQSQFHTWKFLPMCMEAGKEVGREVG